MSLSYRNSIYNETKQIFNGELIPLVDGVQNIGDVDHRWQIFAKDLNVSGIATVSAGTELLPSIVSALGTPDTGIWFPAANVVALSAAGIERLRANSTGVAITGVVTATSFNLITALASAMPLVASTIPAIGISTKVARQDHVHPTDTSRAAVDQIHYVGTTSIAINRASAVQTLTGVSIDGNAATATNAQYTTTAAAGTNNTQIASTAFVSTALANLIASAPAALNTLNELAAALGNDANFATTITNSIATKAPLTGAGASGTWAINITGSSASCTGNSATSSSSPVLSAGTGATCLEKFQNCPPHGTTSSECYNVADAPDVGWWIIESKRHSAPSGLWGTQIAWGWEGNANRIFQRNVSSGAWSAWVEIVDALGNSATATTAITATNVTGGYVSATTVSTTGDLFVGTGASSNIYMSDSDEGTRRIHCNTNRIGFLNQAGAWGAYCNDDGSWGSDVAMTAPAFYGNLIGNVDWGYVTNRPTTLAGYGIVDSITTRIGWISTHSTVSGGTNTSFSYTVSQSPIVLPLNTYNCVSSLQVRIRVTYDAYMNATSTISASLTCDGVSLGTRVYSFDVNTFSGPGTHSIGWTDVTNAVIVPGLGDTSQGSWYSDTLNKRTITGNITYAGYISGGGCTHTAMAEWRIVLVNAVYSQFPVAGWDALSSGVMIF